ISRRPSSRRSVASPPCGSGAGSDTHGFFRELETDAAQGFGEKLGLAAEPDAKKSFKAEILARDDQDAVVGTDALRELAARCRRVVLHQAKRAGLWLAEFQKVTKACNPFAHERQVVLQDGASSGVQLLPI